MATAAEVLRAYREQAGLDADEAIALLVDFLASYGMTDSAADALCDYIDDEGMTEDFAGLLKEDGLTFEPGITMEDEEDPSGDETD
jgi:alkanesulfonate monooxygenase SsuD/methylene tetrahydromethanopterin reductase-like flavin-dependent oxidoreductase (luciferase family)